MTCKEKSEFKFGFHVHIEHIIIFRFDIAWITRKNQNTCLVSMCMLTISLFSDLSSRDLQGKIEIHVWFTLCLGYIKEKSEFMFGFHVHIEHIIIFRFDIAWLTRKNQNTCLVSMCMLSISLFLDLTSHDLQGKIEIHVWFLCACWAYLYF